MKSQDAASLKSFANKLHGAVVTVAKSKFAADLNSRTTMMVLESKLPHALKEKWNLKKKKDDEQVLNVLDLDDWISTKALSKENEKNVFSALNGSSTKDVKSDSKKISGGKKGSSTLTSTIAHVAT